MCVLVFSATFFSETFRILRRIERDTTKKLYWFPFKVSVILVRFLWNLNFLDRFSKNTQILISRKIRPLRAELFHADGRKDRCTDVTKLIDAFRNFAKAPKNVPCAGVVAHVQMVSYHLPRS